MVRLAALPTVVMGEEFDRLLTEMAAHFDALVGEVERVIEEFAATTVVRTDLESLERARARAEEVATLVRAKLSDGGRRPLK